MPGFNDLFSDEITFTNSTHSKLPLDNKQIITGNAELFNDTRIKWAEKQIGGFNGKNIIELGPLEGGHTYMVEKMGASSITAIEANTRAYLKCLITKEIFDLKKVKFLLGDFNKYFEQYEESFDICLALGVLYHSTEPGKLLALIAAKSKAIVLWTHYYDKNNISEQHRKKFKSEEKLEINGYKYTAHKYMYQDALSWSGFCGGAMPFSYWIKREDIIGILKHSGYRNIIMGPEEPNHVNGSALTLVALE